MDRAFKPAFVGGFRRKEVIEYLRKMAEDKRECERELELRLRRTEQENADLRRELEETDERSGAVREQIEDYRRQADDLSEEKRELERQVAELQEALAEMRLSADADRQSVPDELTEKLENACRTFDSFALRLEGMLAELERGAAEKGTAQSRLASPAAVLERARRESRNGRTRQGK